MTVEDRLAFMSAKKAELRSIFENGVWQLELEPEKASEGRVLKARFVLKCVDDGKVGTKAKARLVLQGYAGPDLLSGSLETSSPTFNRTSRQVLLSIGVLKEWEFLCADVWPRPFCKMFRFRPVSSRTSCGMDGGIGCLSSMVKGTVGMRTWLWSYFP